MDKMLGYLWVVARQCATQCSLFLVLLTLSCADSLAEEMVIHPDDDPAVAEFLLLHKEIEIWSSGTMLEGGKLLYNRLLEGANDQTAKENGLVDDYLIYAAEFVRIMLSAPLEPDDLYKRVIAEYPDSTKCLQSLPYYCRRTPFMRPELLQNKGLPLSPFVWHRQNRESPFVIVDTITAIAKLGEWVPSYVSSEPWHCWEWFGAGCYTLLGGGSGIKNPPFDEAMCKRLNDEARYKTADDARVRLLSKGLGHEPSLTAIEIAEREKGLREVIARYDLRDIVRTVRPGDLVDRCKLFFAPSVGAYSALMAMYMVYDRWEKVLEVMKELTEIGLGEWLVAVGWEVSRVIDNPEQFNNMELARTWLDKRGRGEKVRCPFSDEVEIHWVEKDIPCPCPIWPPCRWIWDDNAEPPPGWPPLDVDTRKEVLDRWLKDRLK